MIESRMGTFGSAQHGRLTEATLGDPPRRIEVFLVICEIKDTRSATVLVLLSPLKTLL